MSLSFSEDELAGFRETGDAYLPDQAQILRYVSTPDGAGGFTQTWSVLVTVPARYDETGATGISSGGAEGILGFEITAGVSNMVSMPHGTDVREKDRIVDPSNPGETYEVTGVIRPKSWEVTRKAITRRLQV